MAYAKTNWTNTTPINTTNLNNIENGIEANDAKIGDLSGLTTPTTSSLVGAINSIVESGSNSNGSWIKYADGTIEEWGAYSINSSDVTWTALGNLFYSNSFSRYLPAKLININNVNTSNNVSSRSANYDWVCRNAVGENETNTFLSFNLLSVTNSSRNITIYWNVKGKWK